MQQGQIIASAQQQPGPYAVLGGIVPPPQQQGQMITAPTTPAAAVQGKDDNFFGDFSAKKPKEAPAPAPPMSEMSSLERPGEGHAASRPRRRSPTR